MKHYLTKVRVLAMVLCAVLCLNTSINVMPVYAASTDAATTEVVIDANGGTFNVITTDGTEILWQTGSYTGTVEVGATLFDSGARPTQLTNGDKRFVGWSVWEKNDTGSYVDAGVGYLLTPNMETYTISDKPTKFVAEWVEPGTATVQINCYGGTFNLTEGGETRETNSYFGTLEAGKTLAECGILLSAAVNEDGETGFEGWDIYHMVDDMLFPYNLYTVESLSEYELPVGAVFIVPRWEPPLYVTVDFYGNGGNFDLTVGGETTKSSYYNASLEEGKTIAECGITITDPVHDDSKVEFLYWEVSQFDEMGMTQNSLGNYTTAELMNYVVPDKAISIHAQWDYPMECQIRVKAYGGSFQTTTGGTVTETDSFCSTLTEGETLAESGVSISTPVFSEEGTQFSHWSIRQWDAETKTYSFVGEYTTEEMLAYPADEQSIMFYAQWSGDKDGYYGNVCVDANGGTFNVITSEDNLWQTDFYSGTFGVGNYLFDYGFGISELTNGDKRFVGWRLMEMDETGSYVDAGGFYYDTTNVGMYTITDKQVKFVAEWLEPGTAMVEINCFGGTFNLTEGGETRETSSYFNTFEAGKTLAECGISLSDAVNEDGETGFECWYVDTMIDDMLGPPNWYTTEALLNYTLPEAAVIITPYWEQPEYVTVEINGNGGIFDLTVDGEASKSGYYAPTLQEGKTIAECGITITDPVHEDGRTEFLYWTILQFDGNGTLNTLGTCTSEELMNYVVPDRNITFGAEWDYVQTFYVEVKGYGGSFSVNANGTSATTDSFYYTLEEGKTLAECGVNISAPVFPDGVTQFAHWSIQKWDYETETYSFVGEYTTEEMLTYPIDENGIMFYAQWKAAEPASKELVFEGLSVSYDAEQNVIAFVLNGYDEDSADWQYNISFSDGKGTSYCISRNQISENPYRLEYSADKLPNGRYIVVSVEMIDSDGTAVLKEFPNDSHVVTVTNSPYACPVAIADITASKEVVEVSEEKAEDVTVTVLLERGNENLVKDAANDNRVGYLAYKYSDYINLYMDEQGNITGTYPVDWLVESGMENVLKVWLNVSETVEGGGIRNWQESFEYGYDEGVGGFQVQNSTEWQGDLNEGPVRVLDFSITNKATGEKVENGTYFDVADGQEYTLIISFTLDKDIPDGVKLEAVLEDYLGGAEIDIRSVELTKQADRVYSGEITIDDDFLYTQYVLAKLRLHRGYRYPLYSFNDGVQPYFNIKCGEQYDVLKREILVSVYRGVGDAVGNYKTEELHNGTVYLAGVDNTLTLEELFGGEKQYAEVIAKTAREDGITCDGWLTGYMKSDTFYELDATIQVNDSLTLYPSYSYTDVTPIFEYYDEEGTYVKENGEAIRIGRFCTILELFEMLKEAGKVPDVPAQGEHEVIGWSAEVYEYSAEQLVHTAWQHFSPIYEGEYERITTQVLDMDGQFVSIDKIFFWEEDMTVGDFLEKMPAPKAVEGYNFLRWEITEGHQCYIGSEYIDFVWVPQYIDWAEDMLLAEYGCPWQLTAIYEEVGMSEAEAQVRAFLERMYTVALGRATDPSGVDYWTNQLLSHADDGATVSRGFILGEEFAGKNYSNEEFVTILYSTFFDRTADEGGKTYWSSILEGGATRASVLAGFVNSNEFFELCNEFGISRGVLRSDGSAINPGIYQFSERLYSEILERQGDMGGIEHWTTQLDARAITPEHVAASFFFGGEYLSKNTTNEQYVQALYRTFMGREADADGLAYWKGMLESEMDRMTVLWSFAACPEFQTIKKQYGL